MPNFMSAFNQTPWFEVLVTGGKNVIKCVSSLGAVSNKVLQYWFCVLFMNNQCFEGWFLFVCLF